MGTTDQIKKWITTRKNVYSIFALVGLIVLLAVDFAYWADAIDVIRLPGEGGELESEVEGGDVPDDYDSGPISGNLPRGSHIVVQVPDPRGEGEGETYDLYQFPVEGNFSKIEITSTGDPGRPRADTGDGNDIDLYGYLPGNDASGDQDSTTPDYQAATPSIRETLIVERTPRRDFIGNWTLRVDCYTGNNVQYEIHIMVFYGAGNQTGDGT